MEELLKDPSKLAGLLSMLAFGFVARWVYFTQRRQHEKEEVTLVTMWALVWSAVLALIFKFVDVAPPEQLLKIKLSDNAQGSLALLINIAWSALIGLTAGRLTLLRLTIRMLEELKLLKGLKSKCFYWFAHLFDRRLREYRNTIDFKINYEAKKKWIVVETTSGKWLEGWPRINDMEDTDDYHLELARCSTIDPETGKKLPNGALGSVVIAKSEVKSIQIKG